MKINNKLVTPEEAKELKYVGIKRIRLQYKGQMKWAAKHGIDSRMWDVIEPKLPGYTYDGGYPTFTIAGLKEKGLL